MIELKEGKVVEESEILTEGFSLSDIKQCLTSFKQCLKRSFGLTEFPSPIDFVKIYKAIKNHKTDEEVSLSELGIKNKDDIIKIFLVCCAFTRLLSAIGVSTTGDVSGNIDINKVSPDTKVCLRVQGSKDLGNGKVSKV